VFTFHPANTHFVCSGNPPVTPRPPSPSHIYHLSSHLNPTLHITSPHIPLSADQCRRIAAAAGTRTLGFGCDRFRSTRLDLRFYPFFFTRSDVAFWCLVLFVPFRHIPSPLVTSARCCGRTRRRRRYTRENKVGEKSSEKKGVRSARDTFAVRIPLESIHGMVGWMRKRASEGGRKRRREAVF